MVFVGRLSPEKNVMSLICAAEASQLSLDLYGPLDQHDPDFVSEVLHVLSACRYVRWRGPIPFGEVRQTLQEYRVFVNPSFSEGMPVSVLEAAAEGLYLVLSDIPQHRLLQFPACHYVDPHHMSFDGLVGNLLDGAANYGHVRQKYGIENMVASYLKVYQEVV